MLLNKFPGDVHIRFNTNFKQIYKLIHDFVIERATAKYENSEANQEEELPIHNALVDYMQKVFGVSGISDKRQKEFLMGLYQYKQNKKIAIFARMLGMDNEEANYSEMEYRIYIEAINQMIVSVKKVRSPIRYLTFRDTISSQIITKG